MKNFKTPIFNAATPFVCLQYLFSKSVDFVSRDLILYGKVERFKSPSSPSAPYVNEYSLSRCLTESEALLRLIQYLTPFKFW